VFFFFSSRRRHTRSTRDWSSDVCSSDLTAGPGDTLKLVLQSLRRQGGLPDRFECDGLFQVSPDFTHQEFMGDRLLERLRGSYLKIGRASCRARVWMAVVGGVACGEEWMV